jgi:hypothetical protein
MNMNMSRSQGSSSVSSCEVNAVEWNSGITRAEKGEIQKRFLVSVSSQRPTLALNVPFLFLFYSAQK